MGFHRAFEELAFLCDTKGWKLELARIRDGFELRVCNLKGQTLDRVEGFPADQAGRAAAQLKARIEQRV